MRLRTLQLGPAGNHDSYRRETILHRRHRSLADSLGLSRGSPNPLVPRLRFSRVAPSAFYC